MDYLKKLAKKLFQYQARVVLKKYKPKVIAISGSVGKTLTKEAIYLLMSKRFHVRKTEKSFTTELGIPLAIIGCRNVSNSIFQWAENLITGLGLIVFKSNYPEWLILEVDTDKPGDLRSLYQYLPVDILVMTAVGEVPSHIEAFYEMANFLYEKKHIVESLNRDGLIIYNADDLMATRIVERGYVRKVPVGNTEDCLVKCSEWKIMYGSGKNQTVPTGMSFGITYDSQEYPFKIFQTIGVQNEYACALAFAVGIELGLSPKDVVGSLSKFTSLPGRMNIIAGKNDSILIDDSYNAAPIGMQDAILSFTSIASSGKKIAVIGDMLELGRYSAEEHKKIAPLLNYSVSYVLTVGIRARRVAQELLSLGFDESHVMSFDDSEEAGIELSKLLEPGDVVLVKGSQAMRMERVVEIVMRHPEDMEKLLVRQERHWKARD